MRDPFVFDSRSEFCKKPFGAVPCGSDVVFHVRPLTRDGYSRCVLVARREFSGEEIQMELLPEAVDGERTRFTGVLTAPSEPELLWYHFRLIRSDGSTALLDQSGWQETGEIQSWQLTVYEKTATPLWFGGGVVYQIFPDRFCRLSLPDPTGLVGNRWVHENWNDQPVWAPDPDGEVRNRDFFGGSLNGITAKLDDLAALGVTVLYLNPIFESASNHRYNTADYLHIDPMLGTEEDFRRLCREAKERGIRVILDGVFNHTGSQSRYFNADGFYPGAGAAQSTDSPYFNWFSFHPWPTDYDAWWGIMTLPAVQENEPDYRDFIIRGQDSVVRHWLRAGASGWRLDVADELPDSFLDQLTEAAKEEKPDAVVLGEVWEDATTKESYGSRRRYLLGRQLDSVMNYPFRNAVLGFFTGADAAQIAEGILSVLENYPPQVVRMLMNHIGTHDTERAVTVLAGEPSQGRGREWQSAQTLSSGQRERGVRLMMAASAMQYTLPGVPCVYYGDEAGMEGYKDPFNRGCYPWGRENQELLAWYRRLGEIREEHPVFKEGSFRLLKAKGSLLAYVREDPEGKSPSVLCAFCSGKNPETLDLPLEFQNGTVLLGGSLKDRILTLQGESCCLIRAARDLSAFAAGEERDMKIYVPNVPKA